jgi:hypothetical protein
MFKKIAAIVLVITMLLTALPQFTKTVHAEISPQIKVGDYVQFGKYYDEAILWRVINIDADGDPLLFSDRILSIKAYDSKGPNHTNPYAGGYMSSVQGGYIRTGYGSNLWRDSNIRQWLNNSDAAGAISWVQNPPTATNCFGDNGYDTEKGFLADGNFSTAERNAIKPVNRRVPLSYYDENLKEGGTTYYNYHSTINEAVIDYDQLYYHNLTDSVFFLNIKELYDYVYMRGFDIRAKPTQKAVDNSTFNFVRTLQVYLNANDYWMYTLCNPQGIGNPSIVFSEAASIGSYGGAAYGVYGVRPACYIDLAKVEITSGDGGINTPYIAGGNGSSTGEGNLQETIDKIDQIRISTISDQVVGTEFEISFEALDAAGQRVQDYSGTMLLTADGCNHVSPPIVFMNKGYGTAKITIMDARKTSILLASSFTNEKFKGGIYGISNEFNVIYQGSNLKLKVFDPDVVYGDDAVPGAKITWNNTSYVTDENGEVNINSVPDNQRNMIIVSSMPGKMTRVKLVRLNEISQKEFLCFAPSIGSKYIGEVVFEPFNEDITLNYDTKYIQVGSAVNNKISAFVNWGGAPPEGRVILKQQGIELEPVSNNLIMQDEENSVVEYRFEAEFGKVFKAGEKVYTVMQESTGKSISVLATNLVIQDEPVEPVRSMTMDLVSKETVTTPSNSPFIGALELGLDIPGLKCNVSEKDNKVEIVVGNPAQAIGELKKSFANPLDNEQLKMFQKCEKKLKAMASKNGNKVNPFQITQGKAVKGFDPSDVIVAGYFSGEKKDGQIELQGMIFVQISGSYTYRKQAMVGYVPVYFKAKAEVGLKYYGGIAAKIINEQLAPILSAQAGVTFEVYGDGGVGIVDVVSVGVGGMLKGEVFFKGDAETPLRPVANVTASIDIVARALFFEERYTLKDWKWDSENPDNSLMAESQKSMNLLQSAALYDAGKYKLMSRDYIYEPSVWKANARNRLFSFAGNKTNTTLQTNIYPEAKPHIVNTSDGKLMLWIRDNSSRSSANRTELVFSKYNPVDNTWSLPQAVKDDGTADFNVNIAEDGDNVYVIWQNINKTFEAEEANLQAFAGASEIAVAKYDGVTGVFSEAVSLTADGTADFSPIISVKEGKAFASWLHNEQNDMFGSSAGHSILYSVFDGINWSSAADLAANAGRVASLSVVYDGTNGYTAYSLDMDNDLNTLEDREICYSAYNNGQVMQPVRVTENLTLDSNPQLILDQGKPALYWFNERNISGISDLSAVTQPVVKAESTIFAAPIAQLRDDFKLIIDNGKKAVLWTQAVPDGSIEMYSVLFDGSKNMWSEAFQLSESGKRVLNMDGMFNSDGSLSIVYNGAARAENSSSDGSYYYTSGQSDLFISNVTPSYNIAIEGNIVWSDENFYPGMTLNLQFDVLNKGELPIEGLKAEVYVGNPDLPGAVINNTVNLTEYLKAGEVKTITMPFIVPSVASVYDIYVKVVPLNATDFSLEDNKAAVKVGYTDIVLSKMYVESGMDKRNIIAEVRNNSPIPAGSITVNFRENDAKGSILASRTISELGINEVVKVNYQLDVDNIAFVDGSKTIYAEITCGQEEYNTGNNEDSVILKDPYSQKNFDVTVQGTSLEGSGLKVEVIATNNHPKAVGGKLVLALYDPESDVLIKFFEYEVLLEANESKAVTETIAMAGVDINSYTVKAFMYKTADVNHDDNIDILDIKAAAEAYNAKIDSDHWVQTYDMNGDGIIDLFDLVIISAEI